MSDKWVEVGVVGRPHGVRGETRIFFHNPDTNLATRGRVLHARASAKKNDDAGGTFIDLTIRSARPTPKGWLVWFEGVGQREAAAALTNHRLFIEREDLPALAEGEFYLTDLVGLEVRLPGPDGAAGERLGVVAGFFETKAHGVCVIRRDGGKEVLVPFLDHVVLDIDVGEGWVCLDVPEGTPGLDEEEAS